MRTKYVGISKRFGDFYANRDVNFDLYPGEVHCLCGENCRHARHCVSAHCLRHPGHMPRVQNVFQTVPQDGSQDQRSSGCGRHAHFGQ